MLLRRWPFPVSFRRLQTNPGIPKLRQILPEDPAMAVLTLRTETSIGDETWSPWTSSFEPIDLRIRATGKICISDRSKN